MLLFDFYKFKILRVKKNRFKNKTKLLTLPHLLCSIHWEPLTTAFRSMELKILLCSNIYCLESLRARGWVHCVKFCTCKLVYRFIFDVPWHKMVSREDVLVGESDNRKLRLKTMSGTGINYMHWNTCYDLLTEIDLTPSLIRR